MEAIPVIFSLRKCYDMRRKGKLHPCFQYMQSAGTVFEQLTATCHKDKMQPMLINRGLAISTHKASSDLYFQTIDLTLIFALSNKSWNT